MTKAQAEPAHDELDEASAWLLRLRSGDASRPKPMRSSAGAPIVRKPPICCAIPGARCARRRPNSRTRNARPLPGQTLPGASARCAPARAFIGFAVAAGASLPCARRCSCGRRSAISRPITTGTGEQRSVALSSRVTVALNTQTRLDVLAASNAAHGVEVVAGEAEIDAAAPPAGRATPIQPVTVVAGGGLCRRPSRASTCGAPARRSA